MAEKILIEKEYNTQLNHQLATMDALVFLPDYLFKEITTEGGEVQEDDEYEFTPAMLYQEQINRMFPRELTCRMKLLPAYEEQFMREEESRNDDKR